MVFGGAGYFEGDEFRKKKLEEGGCLVMEDLFLEMNIFRLEDHA
jgi:hypothetical protein